MSLIIRCIDCKRKLNYDKQLIKDKVIVNIHPCVSCHQQAYNRGRTEVTHEIQEQKRRSIESFKQKQNQRNKHRPFMY